MESLRLARKKSGLLNIGFHDCRHFFISYAVMSGIDYMTIARWVGHKDGGILIGKVYGHLSNEQRAGTGGAAELWPGDCDDAKGSNWMRTGNVFSHRDNHAPGSAPLGVGTL